MNEENFLTDEEAMNEIQLILSGYEWDAGTVEKVADVVRQTARFISPPGTYSI